MTIPSTYSNIINQVKQAGDYQPEAIENVISSLLKQADLSGWIIGDLINMAGGDAKTIERFAKEMGKPISTLTSYAYTARTWTESDNRWHWLYDEYNEETAIKYSHLKELNSIVNDPEFGMNRAKQALEQVGQKLMTVTELKRYIAVDIRGKEPTKKKRKIAEFETGLCWNQHGNMVLHVDDHNLAIDKTYIIQVYEIEE